ncbi:hypothetical protein E0H75_03445 [Kribbella capetownensis]|uniref:DUF5671 domain-containing protein n=1 Tax=Kribbella capetownensis TaxID=1572659 RepID=A0A4R0KBU9_9ACTN|nr:hypothetical protein [Kribbella capetownensis]TCC52815.1 hypothetical protein E0H75_03445 [Kribbella capetownensis]
MSSQDFPTYGRGDEPEQSGEDHHYAKPAPYDGGTFGSGPQSPPDQGHYAPPQPYSSQPGPYGPPPGAGPDPAGGPQYNQPPSYRPGTPYGPPAHPQQHELPTYGRDQPVAPRDPRAARVVLLAAIIAGVYGLLVISIQRVALREISQAPGSPLNHPLRTDVIDTIGQLLLLLVGAVALWMWGRDVLARRRAGRQPDPVELGGLLLVAVSMVPILIWLIMVLSTGLGAIDDSVDRLPTAYGWGGLGLLILAAGFALGYRALKPELGNPVVQARPDRPPWE